MDIASKPQDRIEREIMIDAPIEQVWRLVSEPGWWIGDGDHADQVVTHAGELVVVDDPRFGRWAVLPVSSQPPHHVSFRWPASPGDEPSMVGDSTLVEFLLAEQGEGTRLRVVESGLASVDLPAEQRVAAVEGKEKGWREQLGYAKRDVERIRA
jgi:uncharacterized protein YndB with AHSA1/START domain